MERYIVLSIIIGILITTARANADPLDGKTYVSKEVCTVPAYNFACTKYEDHDNWYYALPNMQGEVIVIKQVPKATPDIQHNYWVAPELEDDLRAWETANSF